MVSCVAYNGGEQGKQQEGDDTPEKGASLQCGGDSASAMRQRFHLFGAVPKTAQLVTAGAFLAPLAGYEYRDTNLFAQCACQSFNEETADAVLA